MHSSVRPPSSPDGQNAHILLVEDNVAHRLSLAECLRSQQYIVYEASTTDEATLLLSSPLLDIHLVITDIWLPGLMSGWNFVEYVRYAFPALHMIIISGMDKNVAAADEHTVFFQKPYNFEDISLQISKMLHKRKEM